MGTETESPLDLQVWMMEHWQGLMSGTLTLSLAVLDLVCGFPSMSTVFSKLPLGF